MYQILGADGRLYGPATGGQVRGWIAEGRANAQTQALAAGAGEWKPLGTLPEFADLFASPVPLPAGPAPAANSFAMIGMVCGILSVTLCCCYGLPFNLLGLVFSLVGLSQINQHPERYTGRGPAIAGLVLSLVSLGIFIILITIGLVSSPPNFRWSFQTN